MYIHFLQVSLLACLFFTSFSSYGQAVVKGLVVNGKTLSFQANQPVRLSVVDKDVTFTFATSPWSNIRYRYKLVGFDQQWCNSRYPIARYTNLSGGEYVLVICCVINGRIAHSTSIPVLVERRLVEEWWFIPSVIIYILVLLGAAIYFFILYNFRQKLKVQAIRYRLAADLHDEVGATLSSIAMATHMVQRKLGSAPPDVNSLLDHIKSDSEETVHTIRDTVWTINPDNDSPQKLFEKMRSFAFQVLTAKEIALQFDNQALPNKQLKINMEQRRNLYLIFKEAIHNIAKHSEATKACVWITRSTDGLHWLIEDNGIGFDTQQLTNGNGLRNFRSRASESFIDLTIDAAPGNGTRIRMMVPEL
jgi:hypothetical protein